MDSARSIFCGPKISHPLLDSDIPIYSIAFPAAFYALLLEVWLVKEFPDKNTMDVISLPITDDRKFILCNRSL